MLPLQSERQLKLPDGSNPVQSAASRQSRQSKLRGCDL